ncbi:hypothetical protein C8Q73DRAFT_794090 [Cubamyces lactineus]|nr:hypothetical protein C8Q73DRAFT_794090 [Cubamyces lactineus]
MEAPAIDFMPMIAPLFVANSLNWLALGALFVQIYYYTQHFRTDQLKYRLIVGSLLILELVQTATTTHQAWYYGVTLWDNPAGLLTFPWSACSVPIMAGIIAAEAQIFYAWRIWRLAPNWGFKGMAILIILLALLQALTSIVASIIFAIFLTPEKLLQLHSAFELWVSSSFVTDVLIAACMLWILYTAKNQSGWSRSNNIIGRLIGITVGTGLAIALCGALTLALFATTVGASFQYLPAAYIWGKLYSNSVMVSLNSRRSTASPGNSTAEADSYPLSIRVSHQVFRRGDDERSTGAATPSWAGRKSSSNVASVGNKPVPFAVKVDAAPQEDMFPSSKEVIPA